MAAQVHCNPSQEDLLEHPAKKIRIVDGSYRRSNLGRATNPSQETDGQLSQPLSPTSTASAVDSRCPTPSEQEPAAEMCSPTHAQVLQRSTPMLMRHPQLDPVELAGSLDGWLKHNANLPALKKLRRDSTCSLQSLDAWMDTGIVSPVPGSPSWFRMQPSPSLQATRASPSLDIQVLSPVVPESYPEDMDMMSDGDGDIPLSPPSPGPLMCTPRMDKFMSSPGNTPRRRAPSRLGWRSSPKRDPNQGLVTAPQADKAPPHSDDPEPPATAAAAAAAAAAPTAAAAAPESCAASSEAHEAAELRSLECRFLQLLHAGSGMVLVTDALRLFRGYMDAEEDKEAVRSMLKRWCVLVEHPVGSGCRWLYLRSAAEAAGATLPDC